MTVKIHFYTAKQKMRERRGLHRLHLKAFKDDGCTPEWFTYILDRANLVIVAKEGNKKLGYLFGILEIDLLYLLDLAVDPAYQRRGIGSNLLTLAKLKAKILVLTARMDENLLKFYRKNGFKIGIVKKHYYTYGALGDGIVHLATGSM